MISLFFLPICALFYTWAAFLLYAVFYAKTVGFCKKIKNRGCSFKMNSIKTIIAIDNSALEQVSPYW